MPIPNRKDGEDRSEFMSRCMSDTNVNKEYKGDQRTKSTDIQRKLQKLIL